MFLVPDFTLTGLQISLTEPQLSNEKTEWSGLNDAPPNTYTEVLTPIISECDYI